MTVTEPVFPMQREAQAANGWWRIGLLACLMALLYASTLRGLWDIWWSRPTYAHGILVPFISLYLLWRKRRLVQSLSPEPALILGLLGMSASLAILMVGEAGGIIALSGLSLIGMLASLTALLSGLSSLRAAAFPIAYLIFMVPVLDLLLKPLQWPAQVVTAAMAATFLRAAGIPTFQEGIYIHLPNVVAEVAPGCSGLNFLVSILALGIPLASVALAGTGSRVILIAGAVVIAIVANWVRVAMIGLHNYLWGGGLYGPFHVFQAMAVDWVGFIGLIAGTWVLTTFEAGRPAATPRAAAPPSAPIRVRWAAPPTSPWILAAFVLSIGVVWIGTHGRGPVEPARALSLIPTVIGEWMADESASERPLLALDEADQTVIRTYRDSQGRRIDVYVGYLGAQRQGRELVNFDARYDRLHRLARETFEMVGDIPFAYARALWTTNDEATSLLFWYQIDGRSHAGRYAAKWATIVQALAGRGSNGAFVLLSAPGVNGQDYQAAGWIADFAKALFPFIKRAVP